MFLRTKLIAGSAVAMIGLILTIAGFIAIGSRHQKQAVTGHAAGTPAMTPAQTSAPSGSEDVRHDLQLLSDMPSVYPSQVSSYHPFAKSVLSQPDLFARGFATRLLTQNYADDRQELLAWVQAVSAQTAEPLVVGLVPANLRSKLAVYSVSESADGSVLPVPSASEWASLRAKRAYTTVQVQKVVEPVQWSEAVAGNELTDPGITEREVDALVITHWRQGKRSASSSKSVALTINLEGPPARGTFGFVTAVLYSEVADR